MEAIITTPTGAIEGLPGLPPLHVQLEVEAKAEVYRLNCNDPWKPINISLSGEAE
jgi:hypothetical protein